LKVGKSIVFDGKMGMRKFLSVALPFGKVACAVKVLCSFLLLRKVATHCVNAIGSPSSLQIDKSWFLETWLKAPLTVVFLSSANSLDKSRPHHNTHKKNIPPIATLNIALYLYIEAYFIALF
jgi:hypothetical protein